MIAPAATGDGTADVPVALSMLTRLIGYDPDSPVHFLLRGEAWLTVGDREAARADLLRAQQVVAAALDSSAWGYLNQAYLDRIEAGLRHCD